MTFTVQLPPEIEQRLRSQTADFNSEAKEAMLIEWYRQHRLSHYELSQALALDRFQTDALLKKHNVTEDLPTNEELEQDFQRLGKLVDT